MASSLPPLDLPPGAQLVRFELQDMAFPRDSLRAFLAHAKSALATAIEQSEKVTLVIGNESADLDSLTSSLLYAYIRSLSPPPPHSPPSTSPPTDPLLGPPPPPRTHHPPTPRRHPPLRPHHTLRPPPAAHRAHALPPPPPAGSSSTTTPSPPPRRPLRPPRPRRHRPPRRRSRRPPRHPPGAAPDPEVRLVHQPRGALLPRGLGREFRRGARAGGAVEAWDAQVARVAIASVLVDTGNLAVGGAAEDVDREAVEYLEGRIARVAGEAWDRGGFYEEMQRAKGELGGLALRDVWRKDYKAWREGGGAEGRRPREAFDEAVDAFMREKGLVVYAIMTTYTTSDGRFQRELLLQARPEGAGAAERFVDKATPELGLEAWEAGSTHEEDLLEPVDESVYRRVWRQKEVGRSRKQVAPLLRAAMC
ncbi:MAG: hypothetical protein FRX48_03235 [Lasallia pustulata]|uniref:DHHA2 domain-containing protein n=1 Tax=Lasallia pustulata TaxID=136370 RepID=A0A5M8PWQ2_9LECA|nr:MAG: hypothetical protein FRX48_03235 [Lasallia pustulata]